MKTSSWQQALAMPQTYGLLAGIVVGFAGLVSFVGNRPAVWLGGSSISAIMLGSWAYGCRARPAVSLLSTEADLLDTETLRVYLDQQGRTVPSQSQATWTQTCTWVTEAQMAAQQIVHHDPLLRVEILETLHTLTDLASQVAEGLRVQASMQTPMYRDVAVQHLQASGDRLQETKEQLKQLQDQMMLSKLDRSPSAPASPLPQRLQTLIAANKLILEQTHKSDAS